MNYNSTVASSGVPVGTPTPFSMYVKGGDLYLDIPELNIQSPSYDAREIASNLPGELQRCLESHPFLQHFGKLLPFMISELEAGDFSAGGSKAFLKSQASTAKEMARDIVEYLCDMIRSPTMKRYMKDAEECMADLQDLQDYEFLFGPIQPMFRTTPFGPNNYPAKPLSYTSYAELNAAYAERFASIGMKDPDLWLDVCLDSTPLMAMDDTGDAPDFSSIFQFLTGFAVGPDASTQNNIKELSTILTEFGKMSVGISAWGHWLIYKGTDWKTFKCGYERFENLLDTLRQRADDLINQPELMGNLLCQMTQELLSSFEKVYNFGMQAITTIPTKALLPATWGKLIFENMTSAMCADFEQKLRTQGQYHEHEVDLYYNTFRYYDYNTEQFTTGDQIDLLSGIGEERMTTVIESEMLVYTLDETEFHESKLANIVVENASGPLHPSASFTLFGNVYLSEDGQSITANVSAKGVSFSPEAGLEKVTWLVNATLMKNQEVISEKHVVPHHKSYWSKPNTTIVGEATFQLPPPNKMDEIKLHLKGSYIASFGPYAPMAIPVFPPIFGNQVYVEKTFTLRVENEK